MVKDIATVFVKASTNLKNLTWNTWTFTASARTFNYDTLEPYTIFTPFGFAEGFTFVDLDGCTYFFMERECMFFSADGERVYPEAVEHGEQTGN